MNTQQNHSNAVVGLFPDDAAARQALTKLAELNVAPEAIGVLAVETGDEPAAVARKGLLTGAAMGGVGGALLEATILAFPPATVFIAGGTLVAALAGLSVGAGAGAAAGALTQMGLRDRTANAVASTLTGTAGRVLVSVSSPEPDVRARARTLMRVQGALETHDPDDDASGTHFVTGFVNVVPQMKRHLRDLEGNEKHWKELEPRYRYGWQMANRPDFKDRGWDDAVADLRTDWERRHAEVPWSEAAPFIERGWSAAQQTRGEATKR